jgi:sulfur-oxidizing protein SoxA
MAAPRGLPWLMALALPCGAQAPSPAPPPGAHPPSTAASASGHALMSPALQALQQDDAQNPGLLWVQQGEQLWRARPANGRPACMGCHVQGLPGVAARYPAFSERAGRPLSLDQQINQCRVQHQRQSAWPAESEPLLSLAAWLGWQSRGQAIRPDPHPVSADWRRAGEAWYRLRMGQLNLSCAQCHEQRAGQTLGGALIPSGLATGYPIYRLEWQTLGSLARRLRNCSSGVRAAPLDEQALTQLELYLMQRATGLAVETPAVRP